MRTMSGLPVLFSALFVFFAGVFLNGEDASPAGEREGPYRITEKHNYRKKSGGAYVGAVYREIRGVLRPASALPVDGAAGRSYEGRFFVLEQTKRAGLDASPRVEESFPEKLTVGPAGAVRSGAGGRFPTIRNFPALPAGKLAAGMRWQAFAERILDPDFSGRITAVKVLVDYRYEGGGTYKGFEGDKITAKYAVRYRKDHDDGGDPALVEVTGTHDVSVFLPASAGGPRLFSETFKEIYRYEGGRQTSLEGTVLTFFEGVAPLDRPRMMEDLKSRLVSPGAGPRTTEPGGTKPASSAFPLATDFPKSGGGLPDIDVAERPEGLALTINNLRFEADRAKLLASETGRLELLGRALAKIPDRTFLVVGHTADIGRPEGQMTLSIERAKAIADALVLRGIPPSRVIHEGRGGLEPVAPNDDEEGRAKNRRVEIIILED